jgi:hypothetical protein
LRRSVGVELFPTMRVGVELFPRRIVAAFLFLGLLRVSRAFVVKRSARLPLRTQPAVGGSPQRAYSDLFPSSGEPYVPSGLTRAEYDKIKQKEAEAQAKMNYGAWGPRFRRTHRPDGDWMVVPRLWTSGFSASDISGGVSGTESGKRRWLTNYVPVFLLAYCAIDVLWTTVAALTVHRASVLSRMTTASVRASLQSIFTGRNLMGVTWSSWMMGASVVARIALAVAACRPVGRFPDRASRWQPSATQRRTYFLSLSALLTARAALVVLGL